LWVAVHSCSALGEQNRSAGAVCDGALDRPPTAGGSGTGMDLSLAAQRQDSVAVFLTEIGDVGATGHEDPQPQ
jgi:hypothetical protein